MKISEFWKPFIVCILITPVCLLLAIASGGAGHGNYALAKIFFPYAMLLTLVTESHNKLLLAMAIFQLPIYGLVFGFATQNKRGKEIGIALLLLD